jgi:hypothetical protein
MARGMVERNLALAFATKVLGGTLSDIRSDLPISMNWMTGISAGASEAGWVGAYDAVQRALQHV